jgi:hypothetical protein
MTFAERVLYHQIHPAKVFADVATAIIAIDLFWQRALIPGLVVGLGPPILVSLAILQEIHLEPYRQSRLGAYLRRYMTATAQTLRLFGALLAFYAAWHRVLAGIVAAFVLVAACWAYGIVLRELAKYRRDRQATSWDRPHR